MYFLQGKCVIEHVGDERLGQKAAAKHDEGSVYVNITNRFVLHGDKLDR